MVKHKVYFNNGTELVELSQDSDVRGVTPPDYYGQPRWLEAVAWMQISKDVEEMRRRLHENDFRPSFYKP